MRVVVIGATGVIGAAVATALQDRRHDVVRASRRGDPAVDMADPASIAGLFTAESNLDAVVCCAASAPLTPLTDAQFLPNLRAKLLGQVELVQHGAHHLRDGGSITITSGRIPEATPGSAGGALVNAGLEAFVAAAAAELPRGLRLNAVSPGWVRESLEQLGMDPRDGTPASVVADAYVEAVEGTANGRVLLRGA